MLVVSHFRSMLTSVVVVTISTAALQKHANLRCSSHHFHSLVTSRERDGKKVQLVQAHSEFLSPLGA